MPALVTVRRTLRDHPAPTPQSTPCRLWQGRADGTDAENIADREAKGRGRNFTNVKMTPEQVLEIRARRDSGETAKSIAADFGLTTAGVYSIGSRQAWKSIPEVL